MIKWTMEYVARLFTDGGFQVIADGHNAECGSSKMVTWHPPAAENRLELNDVYDKPEYYDRNRDGAYTEACKHFKDNTTIKPARRRIKNRWMLPLLLVAATLYTAQAEIPSGTPPALIPTEAALKGSQGNLTFPERVAYQRIIEGVYWRHRIWPKERPDPKPPLDAVMSQAELENKVTDYLRKSQAVEDYWQRPITADQLQAEMDRMARNLTAQGDFTKRDPELARFYQEEAVPVELPIFGKNRNMTIANRLTKDPAVAGLVSLAERIHEQWQATDKATALAARAKAEEELQRLERASAA
jgi:hypothetical protein